MIDFSRAFDRVDHNIFCAKLKDLGIGGGYLKWIANYLRDRKQNVVYNKASSELSDVPFAWCHSGKRPKTLCFLHLCKRFVQGYQTWKIVPLCRRLQIRW